MTKYLIIVFLLLLSPGLFAQSKTEKAKEAMDEEKKKTEQQDSKKDSDESSDDSEDSGNLLFDLIFSPLFEFTIKTSAHLMLNIPITVAEEEWPAQDVSYCAFPYQQDSANSFRTGAGSGSPYLLQTQFGWGENTHDDFYTWSINGVLHYSGWALRARYKYLNEKPAPYAIQLYTMKIERKSRSFSFMDMGFNLGVEDLRLGETDYFGFAIGYNLDIFPFRPFSLNFKPNVMFYQDKQVYSTGISLNVHVQRFYSGIEYELLKVAGVEFSNLQFRIGTYF